MGKKRWLSRKFLMALSVQATAIGVLMWPEHESAIVEGVRSVTALVVLALSGMGYVSAEASIDRGKGSLEDSA